MPLLFIPLMFSLYCTSISFCLPLNSNLYAFCDVTAAWNLLHNSTIYYNIVVDISFIIYFINYLGGVFMLPVQKHWENPSVLHVNCEEPRSYYIPYESYTNALKGVRGTSRYYQSLNGIWSFKYYPSVYEVEENFYKEDGTLTDYDTIPVPSCWQLHGYDIPNYTNTTYPYT